MVDDRARVLSVDGRQVVIGFNYDVSLDTAKRYVIDIREWRPRRSLPQNAIWHGILQRVANATGNSLEDVKEYVKQNYGLRVKVFDKLIVKPSSKYTIAEWPTLMEPTIALAGEYGVDIRDIIS